MKKLGGKTGWEPTGRQMGESRTGSAQRMVGRKNAGKAGSKRGGNSGFGQTATVGELAKGRSRTNRGKNKLGSGRAQTF